MATIEACLAKAEELATRVVVGWAETTVAGHGKEISPAYRDLFEKACSYRTAKGVVDNHRKFDCLSEEEAAEEAQTQQAFAQAYKIFADQQEVAA
jgi:hypothetical protein